MVIIVEEMTQKQYDCILNKLGKDTEYGQFFLRYTTKVLDFYRFSVDVGNSRDFAEKVRDLAIQCGVTNAYIA